MNRFCCSLSCRALPVRSSGTRSGGKYPRSAFQTHSFEVSDAVFRFRLRSRSALCAFPAPCLSGHQGSPKADKFRGRRFKRILFKYLGRLSFVLTGFPVPHDAPCLSGHRPAGTMQISLSHAFQALPVFTRLHLDSAFTYRRRRFSSPPFFSCASFCSQYT